MATNQGQVTDADRRAAFISQVRTSWDRWVGTINALTADQAHQPNTSGRWSVKDLIGHVATWDGMAIEKIDSILAGRARDASEETTDDFNARTAAEFQGVALDALKEGMHQTHSRLMDALAGLDGTPEERFGWIEAAITEDTWQHYDEHCQQVTDRFST